MAQMPTQNVGSTHMEGTQSTAPLSMHACGIKGGGKHSPAQILKEAGLNCNQVLPARDGAQRWWGWQGQLKGSVRMCVSGFVTDW